MAEANEASSIERVKQRFQYDSSTVKGIACDFSARGLQKNGLFVKLSDVAHTPTEYDAEPWRALLDTAFYSSFHAADARLFDAEVLCCRSLRTLPLFDSGLVYRPCPPTCSTYSLLVVGARIALRTFWNATERIDIVTQCTSSASPATGHADAIVEIAPACARRIGGSSGAEVFFEPWSIFMVTSMRMEGTRPIARLTQVLPCASFVPQVVSPVVPLLPHFGFLSELNRAYRFWKWLFVRAPSKEDGGKLRIFARYAADMKDDFLDFRADGGATAEAVFQGRRLIVDTAAVRCERAVPLDGEERHGADREAPWEFPAYDEDRVVRMWADATYSGVEVEGATVSVSLSRTVCSISGHAGKPISFVSKYPRVFVGDSLSFTASNARGFTSASSALDSTFLSSPGLIYPLGQWSFYRTESFILGEHNAEGMAIVIPLEGPEACVFVRNKRGGATFACRMSGFIEQAPLPFEWPVLPDDQPQPTPPLANFVLCDKRGFLLSAKDENSRVLFAVDDPTRSDVTVVVNPLKSEVTFWKETITTSYEGPKLPISPPLFSGRSGANVTYSAGMWLLSEQFGILAQRKDHSLQIFFNATSPSYYYGNDHEPFDELFRSLLKPTKLDAVNPVPLRGGEVYFARSQSCSSVGALISYLESKNAIAIITHSGELVVVDVSTGEVRDCSRTFTQRGLLYRPIWSPIDIDYRNEGIYQAFDWCFAVHGNSFCMWHISGKLGVRTETGVTFTVETANGAHSLWVMDQHLSYFTPKKGKRFISSVSRGKQVKVLDHDITPSDCIVSAFVVSLGLQHAWHCKGDFYFSFDLKSESFVLAVAPKSDSTMFALRVTPNSDKSDFTDPVSLPAPVPDAATATPSASDKCVIS